MQISLLCSTSAQVLQHTSRWRELHSMLETLFQEWQSSMNCMQTSCMWPVACIRILQKQSTTYRPSKQWGFHGLAITAGITG